MTKGVQLIKLFVVWTCSLGVRKSCPYIHQSNCPVLSADSRTAFTSVNILKSLDAHVILVPSFSVINEIFVHHYIFFMWIALKLFSVFIVGEKSV